MVATTVPIIAFLYGEEGFCRMEHVFVKGEKRRNSERSDTYDRLA